MKRYKKDQKVVVISGKHKGKKTYILSVLKNNYLLLSDVNVKRKSNKNSSDNFVDKIMPIHSSNISILISN
jgi:ribosomal protein L24